MPAGSQRSSGKVRRAQGGFRVAVWRSGRGTHHVRWGCVPKHRPAALPPPRYADAWVNGMLRPPLAHLCLGMVLATAPSQLSRAARRAGRHSCPVNRRIRGGEPPRDTFQLGGEGGEAECGEEALGTLLRDTGYRKDTGTQNTPNAVKRLLAGGHFLTSGDGLTNPALLSRWRISQVFNAKTLSQVDISPVERLGRPCGGHEGRQLAICLG